MTPCARQTASVSVIMTVGARAATATWDGAGRLVLRVREVLCRLYNKRVVLLLFHACSHWQWFNPLFFFSDTGELPQVLRLLSHDL